MSFRRAKNIFMPKNINCITIIINLKGNIWHKNIYYEQQTVYLTLFVPGFFVIKYPGGVLIGRTPQKFCKIVVMVLFF